VVAAGTAGMEVGCFEYRTHPAAGLREVRVGLAENNARPLVGVASPSNMRSVVVLPAPFGPRNPVIVPSSSSKDRSSTATTPPNRFISDSARTTGASALLRPRLAIAVRRR
jgi:hypothetical protein